MATEWRGRRLNGPNDMVLHHGGHGDSAKYIYFTDPVYAWLEKTRFEDLPYLDERVARDGPGVSGVYRTEFGTGKVELLATMDRPNGIGFYHGDLVVSECCQGKHNPRCRQGMSRWVTFKQSPTNGSAWTRHTALEDFEDAATGGCADGFAVVDRPRPLLLATCAGGLCIVCSPNPSAVISCCAHPRYYGFVEDAPPRAFAQVDLRQEKVVARLWTHRGGRGCRLSNVAVGGGRVYITGECGVWYIPLRKDDDARFSDEL